MNRERTVRFRGALAGTLLLTTLGLLYAEPRLFAAAVVPLAYVAVGALSSLSGAAEPEVDRALSPASPPPGAEVEVTLTVRNPGESALADVRVVDGVPDELAVVAGSPRGALSLRSGEAAELSYSVVAKRGDYDFDDPAVRVRTASATDCATTAVPAGGETTLTCTRSVSEPPFDRASPRRAGTHPTDSGGEGVEFHSTREYRPGDPLSRIDWRRFAKTGDLTTVEFREERAARVAVVVDARPVARTRPSAGYPNGAELAGYAGERLYDALTAANVATDLTAVGLGDRDVDGGLPADDLPWVSADDGGARARLVFDAVGRAADRDAPNDLPHDGTEAAAGRGGKRVPSVAAADGGGPEDPTVRRLLARLPADTQVVLVSPVSDGWPEVLARSLAVRGHETAVLSPDVTGAATRDRAAATGDRAAATGDRAAGTGDRAAGTGDRATGTAGPGADGGSPGRTVAGTRRAIRLRDLRATGATVVDWDVSDPLGIALERSLATLL